MNHFAIHHLALVSPAPDMLAQFYERVLGLKRLSHFHETGDAKKTRSVWLELNPGCILMIERTHGEELQRPASVQHWHEHQFHDKHLPGFYLFLKQ